MAEFMMDCPGCGCRLELLDQWRGMVVDCPECGKSFKVPLAFDAGADQDIPLVAASPSAPADEAYSSPLPIYMQPSESSKKYARQRKRQNAANRFIRIVISLVVLCGVALGLWWAVRFTLFRSAGFAIYRKVDGVVISKSGHDLFFRAEKDGKSFSGEISENHYYDGMLTGFTKYTFDGGYLVSMEQYSVNENGEETLRKKVTADRGRVTEEITCHGNNGEENSRITYQYDWLGRVKSGVMQMELGGNKVEIPVEFTYNWYGVPESMLIDYEKDDIKFYVSLIFNSDGRVDTGVFESEGEYQRIVYEYSTKEDETKGMLTGYSIYNENGRKIGKCTISYDSNYNPSHSIE